ncbi:WD repeat domain-containing protein [Seiridium cupressi]
MEAPMLEFRTAGFNPYAVKYSPYYDSRIAVASAANYGIVGNGRLFCLGLGPQGIQVERTFDTNDAQYDLAWSEINENQLLVACGDGSIKLYDTNVADFPVMNFHEHKRETFSVAWSPVSKDTFASSSWDGTVKIYNDTVIATGGVDRAIRTFDIRGTSPGPTSILMGHDYAIRRLAWSPHASDVLISASYDMTVRLWTDGSTMSGPQDGVSLIKTGMQLGVMNRHTEFAVGVDWCLFGVGGWVATVGWDERVLLWDANHLIRGRG